MNFVFPFMFTFINQPIYIHEKKKVIHNLLEEYRNVGCGKSHNPLKEHFI